MSEAELLLELAEAVLFPRALLVIPTAPLNEQAFAKIQLALQLRSRPALAFRAIAESWDQFRIVREIF